MNEPYILFKKSMKSINRNFKSVGETFNKNNNNKDEEKELEIKKELPITTPTTEDIISELVTPHERTIYFAECRHRMKTYIRNLELGKFYYCDQCVLFRKISEITY